MANARRTDQDRAATRAKVKTHREKLRAQGLRPIQIWVPDTRAPGFAEEVRHQCRLANASPHAKDNQDFIDSISWFTSDEAR
ncbi:MAG: antitoxin MazE family protein [Bacteroidales bacterium]|nr:antitoxin MazE family protein [Bacteroidales bacterium]